jgi:predicted DNA-binding antitoxin AbrB/MazE fold protein
MCIQTNAIAEPAIMAQQIEAVFENGVFRPLQPVNFPEHQRVTLQVRDGGTARDVKVASAEPTPVAKNAAMDQDEATDDETPYVPLPLRERKTIRVKFRYVGEMAPLPYPLEEDEVAAPDELEQG